MKRIFAFAIALLFVTGSAFSQASSVGKNFDYEKHDPIVIPADFPLVLIPMVHKGKGQFCALEHELELSICDLRPDPKTGRLPAVLWLEGKGVALPEMLRAVDALLRSPEISQKPEYWSLSLDELSRRRDNSDSTLELYQSLDAYYEFWNESKLYSSPERATEKNRSLRLIHDGFFKSLLAWGIEKGLRLAPEERSLKVWQRIDEMYRFRHLADEALTRGDLDTFHQNLELAFRSSVDMIYLRDREIWRRLEALHAQHPDLRIIVPIGRAHAGDFQAPPELVIQSGEGMACDPVASEETIQREIRGVLSKGERENFLWLDYLNSKLVAGASETSDVAELSRLAAQIYERIKKSAGTPEMIIREAGARKSTHIRETLLDILEAKKLIDPEEKTIFRRSVRK